jgi:SAM-dependent methyltransferase
MLSYYDFHIKRVNETLKLVNPYIKDINDILNIGYSDFDEYIKDYFNKDISYLIPETMLDNKVKNNKFIIGDICDTNFKINHRYDLVIFTEVLEHLLQDDEIVMMNIKKLVRPKGLLLISVPNALTFSNRVKVITGKNIYWSKKDIIKGVYGGYGHIREYSASEIKGLVGEFFNILNVRGINGYRNGIKKILNILPYTYSNTIAILGENNE